MRALDKIGIALGLFAGGIVLGMYLERTRLYDKFKAMAEKAKQPSAPAPVAAPAASPEATAFAESGAGPAGVA